MYTANHGYGPCTIKIADGLSGTLGAPEFDQLDAIGGAFQCGDDSPTARTITVPEGLQAGDAVVQFVQDADVFYYNCADVAIVHPRSCADLNADGIADDSFDCAGHTNSLSTTPASIKCVANPCTQTECCTDTTEAHARRTQRLRETAPHAYVTASGLLDQPGATFELSLQEERFNQRPHYATTDGTMWLYWSEDLRGDRYWRLDTDEDDSVYMAYLLRGVYIGTESHNLPLIWKLNP